MAQQGHTSSTPCQRYTMSRLPSDQHSNQKQPPTPQLLHTAANLLFSSSNAGGNPTKQRMASQLINAWKQGGGTGSMDSVQMPLPPVAGSIKELLAMLRADPCFRSVFSVWLIAHPRRHACCCQLVRAGLLRRCAVPHGPPRPCRWERLGLLRVPECCHAHLQSQGCHQDRLFD